MQYENFAPTREEFHPQPYEQLAKVYRAQGQFADSIEIKTLQLTHERQTKAFLLWRPFLWLYRLTFGYGFSIVRALATFILCVWVGYLGVDWANRNDLLVLDVTPDYLAAQKSDKRSPTRCGDNISPLIYALDVFIPLVDLRQEQRCVVRTTSGAPEQSDWLGLVRSWTANEGQESLNDGSIFQKIQVLSGSIIRDAGFWANAKVIYALLGWIVTSLTILTITGTLRRRADS